MMMMLLCRLLAINLVWNCFACSTSIKVVQDTSGSSESLNFSKVSQHLSERYNSSLNTASFNGPRILERLVDECYLYEADKYYYRICPFKNVTQHEKSRYSLNFVTSTFHSVLGFWQGAFGSEDHNKIDSLLFRNGSQCDGNNHRRKVKLNLECLERTNNLRQTGIVTEVVETKKCVYNIQLKSIWICGLGTIFSHLDPSGKKEWNTLLTLRQDDIITEDEYDRYLSLLLLEYGIENSETREFQEQDGDDNEIEDLILQNENLKARIRELEERILILENNKV